MTNCTLTGNFGGNGGIGGMSFGFPYNFGGPGGYGGGICADGADEVVVSSTIVSNAVGYGGPSMPPGTKPGPDGQGGGVYAWATQTNGGFANTLLALNTGPSPDVYSTFLSFGHNLVGITNGSTGFTAAGDLTGSAISPLNPGIAPLAENGGPTLTMALLPGSPAIDAADTAVAPTVDQRGFPRPAGTAADIGAYEYGSVMPTLSISRSNLTVLNIVGSGNTGRVCRLLASPDLSQWTPLATNSIGNDGTALFHDDSRAGVRRFYRLVMP
jgi:hypothetical protein